MPTARDIETAFKRGRAQDRREHVARIGGSTDARTDWLIERIRAVARDAHDAESLARAGTAFRA